jgi:hypothetical protein
MTTLKAKDQRLSLIREPVGVLGLRDVIPSWISISVIRRRKR